MGHKQFAVMGVGPTGQTLFALSSEKGMGQLAPQDYPGVLSGLLDARLPANGPPIPLIVCGMAGARQGWREALYLPLPARLDRLGEMGVRPELADSRLAPVILPGLSATEAGHEDVMRGEETQLLGLIGMEPGFDGVVCLPGTHSKWVTIENGTVTRFETALTGELFALLATKSVLRHALSDAETGSKLEDGFAAGLDSGLGAPERLTSALFRTRAASLVADAPPDWCRGYLSGLLIGVEIAAHRNWRQSTPVVLIGAEPLCRLYASGLSRDGASARTIDATTATRAGLDTARRQIFAA